MGEVWSFARFFRERRACELRGNLLLRGSVGELAHGLQAGKASSAGESVSLVRPEPSEFITYISDSFSVPSEVNASLVPSGDHVGGQWS
jgi:hypothetical protein